VWFQAVNQWNQSWKQQGLLRDGVECGERNLKTAKAKD